MEVDNSITLKNLGKPITITLRKSLRAKNAAIRIVNSHVNWTTNSHQKGTT